MAAGPEAPVMPAAAPPSAPRVGGVVPASSVPRPVLPSTPQPTEPPGSPAKARLRENLQKIAKVNPEGFNAPEETPPAPTPPKPEETPKPEEAQPKPEEGKPAETPPEETPKGKKPTKDFWKEFDRLKERAIKAETALAEAQGQITPETDRKGYIERLTKVEARNKELEEHIAFVDYSKSADFQEKYQKPYESAWVRAMAEVGELNVKDGESVRKATVNDLHALVQLPLGDARALANELFGEFSNDVMGFRNEIRRLADSQSQALETARKTSAERTQEMTQAVQKAHGEMAKFIGETWTKVNGEILNDPEYGKYFKPVDGDKEGNDRLTRGYKIVDDAFAVDPRDPKLTPEQRAAAIRRHAVLRNRAAAAGRLIYQLRKAEAKNEELEKQLSEYKASSPPGGAPSPSGNGSPAEPKGMDRIRQGLVKIARPG